MENHVADQIRFYRRQEGLTQEQLAEAMGVSVAAVSKWEQGQSLPEIPMLMELADFFDLSVDALLGYRLRSNDRKSISERLKVLRREDRYDEGLAEAEKALQKFPNTFTVVYECAKLFEMAGGTRKDKALQCRALDLLTHAIRLLPQNSDPQVSEMSLRLDMANVLLDMEDWERALALFKENNACGLLDDQIGCLLALVKERREEGVPYLSMALLRAVTSLVRVCDGFANVFEARKDMKSAIDILQWKHSVLSGLRKKGTVSELDKISAASHAALARLFERTFRKALEPYPEFVVPSTFAELRRLGEKNIGRGVKMGEGWLLPAEIAELIEHGYNNVICVQPFGCLPNHIVGKGVVRTLRETYPNANICPVDYDAGASKVNQENRIKLMLAVSEEKDDETTGD